ncbi:mannosyltransferase [Rhizophlyctis rosea]|uniref:Chitobiosyldiphosphodolichol beta-mannosyltransferase n=1 Tax=Rhizophlyctis rosea TaxID=64517 RepID=A0AAD5X581_9FUNG|nr:mannosyltransferase [Rhizophlyctis rosea]
MVDINIAVVFACVVPFLFFLTAIWRLIFRDAGEMPRVTLLVLGDIGRSPRMQYHALSLARNGFAVDIVAYEGTDPHSELVMEPNIAFHLIDPPQKIPARVSKLVYLVLAFQRVIRQISTLMLWLIVVVPPPDFMLVQNPPAVPTLLVAQLSRVFRRAKLIIDWHNFGYSIMALNLGSRSKIVQVAKWYEQLLGSRSHIHLCVTSAMAEELRKVWGVKGEIVTLHDRAPKHFRRLPVSEIHDLLCRLDFTDLEIQYLAGDKNFPTKSLITNKPGAKAAPVFKSDRPALIISSTSWTEDEDFSILLEAAKLYDAEAAGGKKLPELVFVITGQGPMKEHYTEEIRKVAWKRVRIHTAWLEASDYQLLLGSADLGVSLHTSSSGLDLPMKIVDMFGCELPVCAMGFKCIDELVQHDRNGLIFGNATELCQQFVELFGSFPASAPKLEALKRGTQEFQKSRWDDNWNTALKAKLKR